MGKDVEATVESSRGRSPPVCSVGPDSDYFVRSAPQQGFQSHDFAKSKGLGEPRVAGMFAKYVFHRSSRHGHYDTEPALLVSRRWKKPAHRHR